MLGAGRHCDQFAGCPESDGPRQRPSCHNCLGRGCKSWRAKEEPANMSTKDSSQLSFRERRLRARLRHRPQQACNRRFLAALKSSSSFISPAPASAPASASAIAPILFLTLLLSLVKLSATSINSYQNPTAHNNKHSGQFQISHLCSARSPFPTTRRVEGATLTSTAADTDMNCTITFRTKSAQQHFVIRFEELKLGCDDHLVLFDGDLDYGQPSIKDFSCRDNMASVPIIKTTGTFLTMRFSSDAQSKLGDGFRLVVTAVFDISMSDCPPEYAFCRSQLCVSRALFCDGVNHCLDNSDEIGCSGPDEAIELPYALAFFVILVLLISIGVIVCIVLHCRRDNPYAAYQHQLQRAFGVPLQSSNSVMFASQQHQHPQYQFFQPANMSPYVTPQHHALIATLPRGYSTLPLNLVRQQQHQQQHQQPQTILAKGNNLNADLNGEYLMMTGLGANQVQTTMNSTAAAAAAIQAAQAASLHQAAMRTIPNSQSVLSSSVGQPARHAHSIQRTHQAGQIPSAGSGGGGLGAAPNLASHGQRSRGNEF